MANINDPVFDEPREHPGFRCKRARVSRQAGSERLGLSLWEVPPGETAYPYHHHLTEEELVLVLDGAPSLRTPDWWRELEEGDVVAFPRGEHGAHQLVNHTMETVRFLSFGLICRRNPRHVTIEEYRRRAVSKRLAERWPDVHVLRTATEDDIASVLGLWEAAGSPPSASDTRDGLVCLLERDPDGLLLAEAGGAIVGTLIAAWDGWRGSFYKLAVHPDHRRRGLATELLREGERHLRAHGAVRLTAIVVDDDPIAMSFGGRQAMSNRPIARGSPARRPLRTARIGTRPDCAA